MEETRQCFNPAGDYVPEFGVCNPKTGVGFCCAKGDTCLLTGLCKTPEGDMYQGGCTDKSFKNSSACPKFCDDPSLFRITLCTLSLESNVTSADSDYCCDGDDKGRCCTNSKNLFRLDEKRTPAASSILPKARNKVNTIAVESPAKSDLAPSGGFSQSGSDSIGAFSWAPSTAEAMGSYLAPPSTAEAMGSYLAPPSTTEVVGGSFWAPSTSEAAVGSPSAVSSAEAVLRSLALSTIEAVGSSLPLSPSDARSSSLLALSTAAATGPSSAALDHSISRSNPTFRTSQSQSEEAGSSPTCRSVFPEPKPSHAPSRINREKRIGALVGVSLGTIIILLALLYLWYRRAYHGRRSSPRGRLHAPPDKPASRISKEAIGSPNYLVDPSSIPASFQRNPNAVAVGIGLAIEMNNIKAHPNTLPPSPDNQPPSPSNHPTAPLLPPSLPPKAKTGPQYQSQPSSPTAAVPLLHHHQHQQQQQQQQQNHTDRAPLRRNRSLIQPPSARLSMHPLSTPITPLPKLGSSRPSSLLRSSTFFRRHPNPLRSNPLPPDLDHLAPLPADDDDSPELYSPSSP